MLIVFMLLVKADVFEAGTEPRERIRASKSYYGKLLLFVSVVNTLSIGGLFPGEAVDLKMNCKFEGSSGELVVTDRRVFFVRPRGLVHSINLGDITEVKVEAAFLGVQLAITTVNGQFRYTCTKVEGESIVRAIARRKTQGPSGQPQPVPAGQFQPMTPGQPFRQEIVKEVVLVVCPHCGQRNDATTRTCTNCGASI
jgi:hypothetical protein